MASFFTIAAKDARSNKYQIQKVLNAPWYSYGKNISLELKFIIIIIIIIIIIFIFTSTTTTNYNWVVARWQ